MELVLKRIDDVICFIDTGVTHAKVLYVIIIIHNNKGIRVPSGYVVLYYKVVFSPVKKFSFYALKQSICIKRRLGYKTGSNAGGGSF